MNQEEQRNLLWSLLGELPDRHQPIAVLSREVREESHCLVERLTLDLNGLEPVPACLVRPVGSEGKTLPAILYHHAHGGNYRLGKEELLRGNGYQQEPPYARALTDQGWAVLCIDCWNFGQRHRRTESSLFKEMLWEGRVLWGMMVYDALRALDYLAARSDIDPERIGTLGMSMGSTLAWWLAALDERIRVCMDLCCLTDFETLRREGNLDLHGLYYFVPGLLKHFQTWEINALIAPRPHLSLAGTRDALTPVEGLAEIDARLREVYRRESADSAWRLARFDCGHEETLEMRGEVLAWLKKWLGGGKA